MDIEYVDKDKAATDGVRNKWRDIDANEVKEAVNSKANKSECVRVLDEPWDLSTNEFPNGAVGTGTDGVIEKWNEFETIGAGSLDGMDLSAGAILRARIDDPGTNWNHWRVYL